MSNEPTKGLRFACLCRVSTEDQAEGYSLDDQEDDLKEQVQELEGIVYNKIFKGDEHGTPAYERKILDELMKDAANKKFDAVIVRDEQRWSRDLACSLQCEEEFREYGTRFFTLSREYNLYDPQDIVFLHLHVTLHQYQSEISVKKMMLSRIKRAKAVHAVSKPTPPGREFDKDTGTWKVDEKFKKKAQKMVKVYLHENISTRELAKRFDMPVSTTQDLLRRFTGSTWVQTFHSKKYKIHEEIPTWMPPFVDPETERQLLAKLKSKQRYEYKVQKWQYLFSHIIYDAENGMTLSGTSGDYYRTWRHQENPLAIRAALIERAVCDTWFESLAKQGGMEPAVDKYFEETKDLQEKRDMYLKKQGQVQKKMTNLVNIVAEHGKEYFGSQFVEKTQSLEAELREIQAKLLALNKELSEIPTRIDIEKERLAIVEKMRFPSISRQQNANYENSGNAFHALPFEEKKTLINKIFSGVDPHGKKYGIYISRGKEKGKYTFVAYGRLGEWQGWIKGDDYEGGSRENGGKSATAGGASAGQRS